MLRTHFECYSNQIVWDVNAPCVLMFRLESTGRFCTVHRGYFSFFFAICRTETCASSFTFLLFTFLTLLSINLKSKWAFKPLQATWLENCWNAKFSAMNFFFTHSVSFDQREMRWLMATGSFIAAFSDHIIHSWPCTVCIFRSIFLQNSNLSPINFFTYFTFFSISIMCLSPWALRFCHPSICPITKRLWIFCIELYKSHRFYYWFYSAENERNFNLQFECVFARFAVVYSERKLKSVDVFISNIVYVQYASSAINEMIRKCAAFASSI